MCWESLRIEFAYAEITGEPYIINITGGVTYPQ